jgi:hypothetical protein
MSKEMNVKKVVGTSGVWGLPSSNTHAATPPTGFCSECQLDNIRNKRYPYLIGSVEPLFTVAINEIDRLNSEATQKKDSIDADLEKSKKKVVKDLANKLKTLGFPMNKIASEIVRRLEGRITRSWIHEILGNEYKDKTHQEVAKKRWKHKYAAPAPVRHGENPEVVPPKDEVTQIMVGVDGREITDTKSGDSLTPQNEQDFLPQPQQPSEQPTMIETQDSIAKQLSQPQQQQQYHFRVLIDYDELSDKLIEVYHKGIKNFWLCGRIENDKLIDMVLEREQPQMVVT